ncbi:uncharacterized protein M6G45_005851 [Spheniscus humboldti]
MPPRSLLPPGEETPLPPRVRGAGGRPAREARNCGAGAAPGHAPPGGCSLLPPPGGRSAVLQRRHRLRRCRGTAVCRARFPLELLRLKLERPEKGKEEEIEGHLAGSCLPLQARESLPLRVEDSQATGVTEEEGRREGDKKHLNCQSLAALRVRTAVSPGPLGPRLPSCVSWALPAPLLAPSLSPVSFPCCCDFFCFPVPLLFSLVFCPAPSSSLPFSFLFYRSLFFSSLCFCPAPSPSFFFILCLCPVAHRCFFLFHLFVLICICLFFPTISLACSLAFFSFLRLYVLLRVPAFLSLSLSFSFSLYPFVLLTVAVFFHSVSHCPCPPSCSSLTLSDPLCCSLALLFIALPLCPALYPCFLLCSTSLSFSLLLSLALYPSVLLPVPLSFAVSRFPSPYLFSISLCPSSCLPLSLWPATRHCF